VPKVQFSFKVVDARIDAPASHKQGLDPPTAGFNWNPALLGRFSSSI